MEVQCGGQASEEECWRGERASTSAERRYARCAAARGVRMQREGGKQLQLSRAPRKGDATRVLCRVCWAGWAGLRVRHPVRP